MSNDRRENAENFDDPQAADVLGQIAPVRTDVGDGCRRAALRGLDAPGIVGFFDEPVLKIPPVQK